MRISDWSSDVCSSDLEERWKTDEAAIKEELERLGAAYISADAQSSNEKQIADIEGLIARGANALIVLAQDAEAVVPAISRAQAEGIPVVGYDRRIEMPGEIGRAHVRTPVTKSHIVCRLVLEKKTKI